MRIIATPIEPRMLQFGELYSAYPQEAWDKMIKDQIAKIDIGLRLCANMPFRLPVDIPIYKLTIDLTQLHYEGWD
jgi:hypothetical protein